MKINNFFNLKLQNKSSYLYFYRKYNTYYNFNKVSYYLWGNVDKSQIRTIENFITESPNIEKISLEYEKKFINLKGFNIFKLILLNLKKINNNKKSN